MLRLLAKLCLYFLPVAALTSALAGLAWHSGELLPAARAAELQSQTPDLIYGPMRACNHMAFKLAAYRLRQPEMLILGNSLTLSVRADFFTEDPAAVYNSSVQGWYLPRMAEFKSQIENYPKILIATAPPHWFIDDGGAGTTNAQNCGLEAELLSMVETAQLLLSGELTLHQVINRHDAVFGRRSLGLLAIKHSRGFAADGSYVFGGLSASVEMQAENRNKVLSRDSIRTRAFNNCCATLNEPLFRMLEDFLAAWQEAGVTVVGLAPPFHIELENALRERDAAGLRDEATKRIVDIFDAFGFPYYYVADLQAFGAEDRDWLNATHLTESGSLRLMLGLFQELPQIFESYTNINTLESLLANYANPFDVLGELDA